MVIPVWSFLALRGAGREFFECVLSPGSTLAALQCGDRFPPRAPKKLWQKPPKIAFSLEMSQGTTPANARTRAKTRAFCPPAWVLNPDYPQPRDRPRFGKVFV
jgi:hypothetical protein